jgi:hypothetical protein
MSGKQERYCDHTGDGSKALGQLRLPVFLELCALRLRYYEHDGLLCSRCLTLRD